MKTAIVIPARYGSTRLPGKPLAMIAGQTMLQRVVALARAAAVGDPDILCVVATDDRRIADHAESLGVACLMTAEACPTGTDRVQDAVAQLEDPARSLGARVSGLNFVPDFVVNLQGDAPLTPPDFVRALIESFRNAPCDVVTPVTQLSWAQLDALRRDKIETPFSGTTVVFDPASHEAHWFSKNILPALRKEKAMRAADPQGLSPVWRHIGLYGYSRAMLARFVTLAEGAFEKLEGLEQLRVLEHGFKMRCVPVSYGGRPDMSGVDSPEDVARAEALLAALPQ